MRSTEYLNKYKKLVRILRILSQIGYIFSAVSFAVLLPLAILLMSGRGIDISFSGLHWGYLDGVIRYNLSTVSQAQMRTIVAQMLFSIVVYSAVLGAILYYLSGFLKAVENGVPFDRNNPRRLSTIGLIFIVGSVFVGSVQASTANVLIHALQLTDFLGVNYSFNTAMLMSGLLLLILASIFRYGTHLQEEYDATL